MGTSVQPIPSSDRVIRIKANVAKMQRMGASEAEIDDYLSRREGLKRKVPDSAAQADLAAIKPLGPSGNVDLGSDLDSLKASISRPVGASSGPSIPSDGAGEGVLDSALNMLTFGLHQKGLGVTQAIGDMLQHGTNAHPIDTYNAVQAATEGRIAAADRVYPMAKRAADAVAFMAPLALEAPVRVALGIPAAAEAARAPGFLNALKRVGKNAVAGGTTAAAMTGIGSTGPMSERPAQMAASGVIGAGLGGGATAVAEGVTGAGSLAKKLFRSAATKGTEAAHGQILSRLAAGELSPEDLLTNAAKANAVGSPAVTAHLGGPAMDDLTYLGASSMSPAGAALKESLVSAQRGEHDLLHRGVTAMSGRENSPQNKTVNFLASLEERRKAHGAIDYPKAYAAPPVDDPRVLEAIANEPYISGALDQSVDVLNRRNRADALRAGGNPASVVHPLREADTGIGRGQEAQLAALYRDDPVMHALARKAAGLPEIEGGASGKVPVQMLDKLQQAAQPGIERGLKRGRLAAEDAGAINDQIQSILRMADETRPDFQAARARQASFFGRGEGGRAGTAALTKTGPEIASDIAGFEHPGQAEAYRTTATSSLRDLVDAKRYGADVGTALFDSPQAQGQMDALYGAGARERLDPYLEQGNLLNRVLKAATGGSQTEPRQAVRAAVRDVSGVHLPTTPLAAAKLSIKGHSTRVDQAMTEALARELNIPADSPELPALVERLRRAVNPGRRPPNMFSTPRIPLPFLGVGIPGFGGVSDYTGVTLAARLAAIAGGGQ